MGMTSIVVKLPLNVTSLMIYESRLHLWSWSGVVRWPYVLLEYNLE